MGLSRPNWDTWQLCVPRQSQQVSNIDDGCSYMGVFKSSYRMHSMFRCLLVIEVFKNDVATLVDLLVSDSLGHYFTLDNIPMKQETDWSRSRTQSIVT